MRLFHTADLHYCPKHLSYVDAALVDAWSEFRKAGPGPWVIAGDSYDATMGIHQPAFARYQARVIQMATTAPGVILQGTFSHDYPGSLNPLKELITPHPVLVADEPGAWDLEWVSREEGFRWNRLDSSTAADPSRKLCVLCVPSLNRADPEVRDVGAQNYLSVLAQRLRPIADAYRKVNVPVILVTHGTVMGCYTESKHAMISPDHEFSLDVLAKFGAHAVLLGHIHKHQSWEHEGSEIVYPGSLAKLVFGHSDPTGYVEWAFDGGKDKPVSVGWAFHEVTSRIMLEFDYSGVPDLDELDEAVKKIREQEAPIPVFVRIRWAIDEEHTSRVDFRRLRSMFEKVGAQVKLEQRVHKIQSVRAKGISERMTIEEKLGYFLVSTGDESRIEELTARLTLARSHEPQEIVDMIATERPEP